MPTTATTPLPLPMPRLWGLGTARTIRPIWLLKELDIEFEVKPIQTRTPSMNRPEFLALSERGKFPILEHGDLVMGESAAISLYLADAYRCAGVLAPDPGTPARALHDELCWFAMTEMDAALYTIRKHEALPEIYGESKVAAESARHYFLRSAAEMERRLADGRTYLLGDDFSVADLLFKTCLDWAVIACRIKLPASLVDYSGRLSARPAFSLAMKMNFPPETLAALDPGRAR